MTTTTTKLITLTAPGEREVVDVNRAIDILYEWKQILLQAATTPDNNNAILHKVVLSNKSWRANAAAMIALYLQSVSQNVKILDLSDVIAGRPEEEGLAVLKSLCDAFRDCNNLVEVNLSDNAMGCKGIKACESVLDKQQESLQRLYLENMGLAAESMNAVADIFLKKKNGKCVCDNIKVLSFHNNMSGDPGAEAFQRILEKCKNLQVLRYSGCRALRDGSKALGMGLDKMGDSISSLESLDFSGSHFGSGEEEGDGVIYLARALARANNLTHANLRDYGLGPKGTALVCKALHKAPLVELDLAENEIGPDGGAKAVAELLGRVVDTLQVFKAEENEFTSLGIKRIVKSLSSERSVLKELRLDLNECGHVGAKALCNATLPKIESIHLNENMFPADDVAKLEETFGDKLQEMEDNEEDEDVDADLEEEEEEEEDKDVDALAEELAEAHI